MVEFEAAKNVFESEHFLQVGCQSKEKHWLFQINTLVLKKDAKNTSSGKLIKTRCLQKQNEFIGERTSF
jgi:hypothetical protein